MKNIATAYSSAPDIAAAVAELRAQLAEVPATTVLYFSSSRYDPHELARDMQAAFAGARTFGCTSAGEIVTGRMFKGTVVAMAFGADVFPDFDLQVLEGISEDPAEAVRGAFAGFKAHFGTAMAELDHKAHLGMILIDGLRGVEEQVMASIGDRTNVPFIGGSAGDDLHFACTYVFADGRAYTDAAVLAVARVKPRFHFLKTQSFRAMENVKLVPTLVDVANRTVLKFDNKPAAEAYAKAVGVPLEKAAEAFMEHPVGLEAEDGLRVHSPQQIMDGAMKFYCSVAEGMPLTVLRSTDIVAETRQQLAGMIALIGGVQGIINFHCILRTLELEAKGQADEYGKLFADVPTVGFSTYGEEFIGHINQTSTMVLFEK